MSAILVGSRICIKNSLENISPLLVLSALQSCWNYRNLFPVILNFPDILVNYILPFGKLLSETLLCFFFCSVWEKLNLETFGSLHIHTVLVAVNLMFILNYTTWTFFPFPADGSRKINPIIFPFWQSYRDKTVWSPSKKTSSCMTHLTNLKATAWNLIQKVLWVNAWERASCHRMMIGPQMSMTSHGNGIRSPFLLWQVRASEGNRYNSVLCLVGNIKIWSVNAVLEHNRMILWCLVYFIEI